MRTTFPILLAMLLVAATGGCRPAPEPGQAAAVRGGIIDLIELSRVSDGRAGQRQARYRRLLAERERLVSACEFSGEGGDLPWQLRPGADAGPAADGRLTLPSAGGQTRVRLRPDFDCSEVREVRVRLRASAGHWGRLFWRASVDGEMVGGAKRFQLITGDAFRTYIIEVSGDAAWRGRLDRIELAPSDGTGRVDLDFIRFHAGLPAVEKSLLQAEHREPGAALALAGDQRPIMRVLPGSPLDLTVELPAAEHLPLLDLAAGIATPGWRGGGNPVRFSVQVSVDGESGRTTIFDRILAPRQRPAERGWVTARVPLACFAGRRVTLHFATEDRGRGNSARFAAWANPMIVTPDEGRTSVLVILVDALRADRLGCLGNARRLSPHIDSYSRRGDLFTTAYAASSWTVPSVASIFTGLYPYEHGVRYLNTLSLDQRLATLAERFRDAGYVTAAISDNQLISPGNGFAQGFMSFNSISRRDQERKARRITDLAAARLGEFGDVPFFLYVHYMDPHGPYQPAAPYDPGVPAGGAGMRPQVIQGLSEWLNLQRIRDPSFGISPAERAHLVRLYEGEVAFTDFHVGRLLARLEALGLDDRTLVAFLADHGEAFAERGAFSHGTSLHEEQIHVPLFIVEPAGTRGAAPRLVARPVRTVDLAGMLLESAGAGGQALPAGGQPRPAGVYSELNALTSGPFAEGGYEASRIVRRDGYKLFYAPDTGEHLLFDLGRDPGERDDLFGDKPPAAAELLADLERHLAAGRPGGTDEQGGGVLSSEQLERLEALGYVEAEPDSTGGR